MDDPFYVRRKLTDPDLGKSKKLPTEDMMTNELVLRRKAIEEDYLAVEKAARRFSARHNLGIKLEGFSWHSWVDFHIDVEEAYNYDRKLRRLWYRCFARAVDYPGATDFAYGYVIS